MTSILSSVPVNSVPHDVAEAIDARLREVHAAGSDKSRPLTDMDLISQTLNEAPQSKNKPVIGRPAVMNAQVLSILLGSILSKMNMLGVQSEITSLQNRQDKIDKHAAQNQETVNGLLDKFRGTEGKGLAAATLTSVDAKIGTGIVNTAIKIALAVDPAHATTAMIQALTSGAVYLLSQTSQGNFDGRAMGAHFSWLAVRITGEYMKQGLGYREANRKAFKLANTMEFAAINASSIIGTWHALTGKGKALDKTASRVTELTNQAVRMIARTRQEQDEQKSATDVQALLKLLRQRNDAVGKIMSLLLNAVAVNTSAVTQFLILATNSSASAVRNKKNYA